LGTSNQKKVVSLQHLIDHVLKEKRGRVKATLAFLRNSDIQQAAFVNDFRLISVTNSSFTSTL